MTVEHIPDRIEVILMRWTAEEELMELAREAGQEYDLDPALVEALEDACRDDHFESIIEAFVDLLRAWREATGGL